MIDAKWLPAYPAESEQTLTVYGVWIPRKGDNLRMTVEVVANKFAVMTATIFQKNYDEPGDGTTTGISVMFSETTGRQTMELLGAMELVRLELKCDPGDSEPDAVGLVLFRVLQPAWFESLKV